MTQGIRGFLNLPSLDDVLKEKGIMPDNQEHDHLENDESGEGEGIPNAAMMKTIEMAQAAQERLDMVEGKDHAIAMDNIHKETLKHAQDLMDLGFNTEINRQRGIFEVATNMYGQAIAAKNAKREAQLKAMKLALDQRKLDLQEQQLKAQLGETEANTIQGEGTFIREDRNELIKRMREQREKK
jgi:multidrug efflux pump subunit AcrA (membrane-fusion protein)